METYQEHAAKVNARILTTFDKRAANNTKCNTCNGTRRVATPFGMTECPLH